ncbi:MAG: hypothetical protein Q4Q07_03285 [Tissierellia bacterium]|nr:hypothetical protein [Tissierellia bacterium]
MFRKSILIFFLIFLVGCGQSLGGESAVSTPKLKKAPVEGKWTITKCIFTEEDKVNNFKYRNMIGKDSIFSSEEVIIANSYLHHPSYRLKRVNTEEFLNKKYNIAKEKIGIRSEYLHVIDIYDQGELFYQILREKSDIAYVDMNGVFVQITKISDEVTKDDIESFLSFGKNKEPEDEFEVYNLSDNGFILGLSSPYIEGDSNLINWSYTTYFFRFLEDEIEVINERPGLILPRQDGFYSLNTRRNLKDGNYQDSVQWVKLQEDNSGSIQEGILSDSGVLKKINFLSSEYINLENIDIQRGNKQTLSLNYLNPLKSKIPLGLSDFVEEGEKIFGDTARLNLPTDVTGSIDEHNIGLVRERGHWNLIGRVNFEHKDKMIHKDFNVNTIIPKDMVKYDDLFVPMSQVKELLPNARDAFTSPNNRFLITLEEDKIKVYNIEEGVINPQSVKEVDIDSSSETVMTEWAIGRYVKLWKKQFEGEEE